MQFWQFNLLFGLENLLSSLILWTSFRVDNFNNSPLEISHLLFADDTLIMCDADVDQIHNLDHILLCFEVISRLKVNLQKSELVAVGEVPYIEPANILDCNISSLPLCYLGLPLGAPFKSKAIWDKVVEKMKKRQASWNKIYLSKGERLTLIKSTLSSNSHLFSISLPPTSWHSQKTWAFSERFSVKQSRRGTQTTFGKLEDFLLPNYERGFRFQKPYSI